MDQGPQHIHFHKDERIKEIIKHVVLKRPKKFVGIDIENLWRQGGKERNKVLLKIK